MDRPGSGVMKLPDVPVLMKLRRYLTVAHHVPGRIRLKLDPNALFQAPSGFAAAFRNWLAAHDGILDVRVNKAALSIVVEYDPVRLPQADWDRLIAGSEDEAARLITRWAVVA